MNLGQKIVRWLIGHFSWILAGVIILVMLARNPAFEHAGYWFTLSRQHFAVAALALVLTPIILTGGIDLSVGSVAVFAGMVVGVAWQNLGVPFPLALACGAGAGLLAGICNGLLVVVRVPPLVATLATRELFRGLAFSLSAAVAGGVVRFGAERTAVWRTTSLGLPLAVYGIAILFFIIYLIVHHTWMGRMLYAIGDNEEAARFAAVPVRSIKFTSYAAAGLVAGLCGVVFVLHNEAARPDGASSLELLAIACVVLGGASIMGGSGSVTGTLLGIITMIVLLAGLQQELAEWRDALTGGLLLGVALCNEAIARWQARSTHTS